MKKYILQSKIKDDRIDDVTSTISGELLPNIDNSKEEYEKLLIASKKFPQFGNPYAFDTKRNPFAPFKKEQIFSPLLTVEHRSSPISKKARLLQDHFMWHKKGPLCQVRVISSKLKNIFEKFNFTKHSYYKAELLHKNNLVKDYFVFQILEFIPNELLNFEKTIFEITKRSGSRFLSTKETEEKQFNSWEDLLKYQDDNRIQKIHSSHTIKSWAVKDKFWELDCFFFYNHGLIISEKLANALNEANLFGYETPEFKIDLA